MNTRDSKTYSTAWLAWSFFQELQDGWLREYSRTHAYSQGEQEEDCRGPSIHDWRGKEGGCNAVDAATTREMSRIARARKKPSLDRRREQPQSGHFSRRSGAHFTVMPP